MKNRYIISTSESDAAWLAKMYVGNIVKEFTDNIKEWTDNDVHYYGINGWFNDNKKEVAILNVGENFILNFELFKLLIKQNIPLVIVNIPKVDSIYEEFYKYAKDKDYLCSVWYN